MDRLSLFLFLFLFVCVCVNCSMSIMVGLCWYHWMWSAFCVNRGKKRESPVQLSYWSRCGSSPTLYCLWWKNDDVLLQRVEMSALKPPCACRKPWYLPVRTCQAHLFFFFFSSGRKLAIVKLKPEAAASHKLSRLTWFPSTWKKEESEAPPEASGESPSSPLETVQRIWSLLLGKSECLHTKCVASYK